MVHPDQDVIPVPRSRVFVMVDGSFVVQWEQNRVQRLVDGRYVPYREDQFGSAIMDYELNQLRNTRLIADYDEEHVYISPFSNAQVYSGRTFYLNTTLDKSRYEEVLRAVNDAGLMGSYAVRMQEIFVIIRGASGMPFQSFDEAEKAREVLAARLPELLGDMVVAFMESGVSS